MWPLVFQLFSVFWYTLTLSLDGPFWAQDETKLTIKQYKNSISTIDNLTKMAMTVVQEVQLQPNRNQIKHPPLRDKHTKSTLSCQLINRYLFWCYEYNYFQGSNTYSMTWNQFKVFVASIYGASIICGFPKKWSWYVALPIQYPTFGFFRQPFPNKLFIFYTQRRREL